MENTDLFTANESRLLEYILNTREKLIRSLVENSLPTKPNEVRVLNELMDSMARQILDTTEKRIKHSDSKANSETLEIIRDVLLMTEKEMMKKKSKQRKLNVAPLSDSELVKDELTTEKINIDVDEILGGR